MKVIKEVGTSNVFCNWRINGLAQFTDINNSVGQIAFFDQLSADYTVKQLQAAGHDVVISDLVIK